MAGQPALRGALRIKKGGETKSLKKKKKNLFAGSKETHGGKKKKGGGSYWGMLWGGKCKTEGRGDIEGKGVLSTAGEKGPKKHGGK